MHDTARPENPFPLSESDVYTATRDFILAFALPGLDPANVIQGWRNRTALPAGTEKYAAVSLVRCFQHGTAVETFRADDPDRSVPGVLSIRGLMETHVRIDFCGSGDLSRQRAARLALMARSAEGVRFFNERGLSVLHADDVRNLSFVGEARQLVRRYSLRLRLTLWAGLGMEMPYFDAASLSRLENVDVHHVSTRGRPRRASGGNRP